MMAQLGSSQLRVGIIGASRVATYAMILPARVTDGVCVKAIAARDPNRACDYARLHGIPHIHGSYEALMADPDIDLVYITTPPAYHADQALLAIKAGKPVLVEKPFAMTASEARRVRDAGQKAGVGVMEAMHSLHHALFRRISSLLAEGSIGPVRHVRAEFSVPIDENDEEFRWKANLGGGALMDLGVYPLAWCRRLLGESFTVTSAEGAFKRGVDEAFSAKLRFSDSVRAEVTSTMVAAMPVARLLIEGTKGSLHVVNPLAPDRGHELRISTLVGETVESVDGPTTYEAQLIAVRNTLVHQVPFPMPADDFVRSMEAIDAVRAAWNRPQPNS
jgi:predicted dehydrogenase